MSRHTREALAERLWILKAARTIDDRIYQDYLFLIYSARTHEQFDAIAQDLTEIPCPPKYAFPSYPSKHLSTFM